MKRLALLVVGAMLATTLALTTNAAAWYKTPQRVYSDSSGGFNVGGSTKYGYDGYNQPGTVTNPQFWASAETHTVCQYYPSSTPPCYFADSIRISVSGTDPNGNPLPGSVIFPIAAHHSPENAPADDLMAWVVQALANMVPYGIGSDLANAGGPQLYTTYDASSAWGEWTSCHSDLCTPHDSGLELAFQVEVDPNLYGTYRIHIAYHVVDLWFTGSDWYISTDLSDDLVYCYQYCTYNIAPIHVQVGGYPASGADVWIYDSSGHSQYHDWTDANGNAPGKWGLPAGTYTAKSQTCESVYRPEPPGYDYFYFRGQSIVTIGPSSSPTLSETNSGVRC